MSSVQVWSVPIVPPSQPGIACCLASLATLLTHCTLLPVTFAMQGWAPMGGSAETTSPTRWCLWQSLAAAPLLPSVPETPTHAGLISPAWLRSAGVSAFVCFATVLRAICPAQPARDRMLPCQLGNPTHSLHTPACDICNAGLGTSGRLGNNNTADSLVPVAVSGSLTFAAITAGFSHTCGLDQTTMAAFCWGERVCMFSQYAPCQLSRPASQGPRAALPAWQPYSLIAHSCL